MKIQVTATGYKKADTQEQGFVEHAHSSHSYMQAYDDVIT